MSVVQRLGSEEQTPASQLHGPLPSSFSLPRTLSPVARAAAAAATTAPVSIASRSANGSIVVHADRSRVEIERKKEVFLSFDLCVSHFSPSRVSSSSSLPISSLFFLSFFSQPDVVALRRGPAAGAHERDLGRAQEERSYLVSEREEKRERNERTKKPRRRSIGFFSVDSEW